MPSESVKSRSEELGYACAILLLSPQRVGNSMTYLKAVVQPAVAHRTIKFYFNDNGIPVGYVVWARLGPEAERRVIRSADYTLHVSEWTEGDSLWIIDLVAPCGSLRHVLADLRDALFVHDLRVRYLRPKGRRVVVKQIDRAPTLSFFAAADTQPVMTTASFPEN